MKSPTSTTSTSPLSLFLRSRMGVSGLVLLVLEAPSPVDPILLRVFPLLVLLLPLAPVLPADFDRFNTALPGLALEAEERMGLPVARSLARRDS